MRLLQSSHAYCRKEPPTSCTWKWRARALLRMPKVAMLFSSSPVLSVVITSIRPCGVPALERFSKLLVGLIIHMTTTPCVYGKWKWSLATYLDSSVEYSFFPKSWWENYVWTCDVNACTCVLSACAVHREAACARSTVYGILYSVCA